MARTLVRGNTQIMPESVTNVEIAFKDTDNPDGILLEKIQHSDYIVRTNDLVNGDITLAGGQIKGVGPAVDSNDVVIKSQLDSAMAGLDPKDSVHAATTGNIDLGDINDPVNFPGPGVTTIDGVSLAVGDRVLVKDQTDPTENGIYIVSTTPWVRSEDANGDIAGEVSGGMFTFVEAGSTNAGTGWVVVKEGNLTVGTSDIPFTQFSGGGTYTAGLGLALNATEFSAKVDNSTIINTAGGDALAVRAGGITGNELATGAVGTDALGNGSITAVKLDGSVAGAGMVLNGSSNALDVNIDGNSLIFNGNTIEVDSSAIAGDLAGSSGTGLIESSGSLAVNVDGTTIQIVNGELVVSTTGITTAIAGNGLVSNGSTIDVNVDDTTIEIDADVVKVKAGGIGSTEINSSAFGSGITGGSGSPIAIDQAVVLAATNYVVREVHNPTSQGTTNSVVTLNHPQVQGTEMVFVNGILMEEGNGNDYQISYSAGSPGVITFDFILQYVSGNPSKSDKVSVTYFKQA